MKKNSSFARFSTLGIQMGLLVAGCAWLGDYLDQKHENTRPWWTLFFMLFGVFAGLTLIIREALKSTNKDDE